MKIESWPTQKSSTQHSFTGDTEIISVYGSQLTQKSLMKIESLPTQKSSTQHDFTVDLEIIDENCVIADSEIINATWFHSWRWNCQRILFTADSEIVDENWVTIDSEIINATWFHNWHWDRQHTQSYLQSSKFHHAKSWTHPPKSMYIIQGCHFHTMSSPYKGHIGGFPSLFPLFPLVGHCCPLALNIYTWNLSYLYHKHIITSCNNYTFIHVAHKHANFINHIIELGSNITWCLFFSSSMLFKV